MTNRTPNIADQVVAFAAKRLREVADPDKATAMAAYMKTDEAFYGVQTPLRTRIAKAIDRAFPITTRRDYEAVVRRLWRQAHREERYLAIDIAGSHPRFVDGRSLGLYEKLIRTGRWWDLVDPIAIGLVGPVLLDLPSAPALLDLWVEDSDMWIRRSALIAHNRHKTRTDWRRLFRHCTRLSAEREFFIRKAIGWALREYSYSAPERVLAYVRAHRDVLSPLSYREAVKGLMRNGYRP